MKDFVDLMAWWSFFIPGSGPAFIASLIAPVKDSNTFLLRAIGFGAIFWIGVSFLVLINNFLLGILFFGLFVTSSIRLDLIKFYAELLQCLANSTKK